MNNKTYISFYLKSNTVRVFTSSVRKIGSPKYVQFLINPKINRMVMASYDKKEFTSFRVSRTVLLNSKYSSLRIQSKRFCRLLANQFGWDINKTYRIPGVIITKQELVVYDLTAAKELSNRRL